MMVTHGAVAMMQVIDAWMVSSQGTEALAAITPAGLMVLVVTTFGLGILAAVNTLVGQAAGRGESARCGSFAWQGIWTAVGLGTSVYLLLPTAPYLFSAFGHSPEIRALEEIYFKICLLALLPQFVGSAIANFFFGTKQPKYPMVGTLIATLANVILNYAFIFGKLGAPALGFAGAAWGTLVASVIYAAVMLVFFWGHKNASSHSTRTPNWRPARLQQIRQIGLPIGVQDMFETVSWGIILVVLVGHFGDSHLAAASVLIRCMQVSFLPSEGVGAALLAMVANSIGANRFRLAREQARLAFRLTATYMGTMAVTFYVFRTPILELFSRDPEVIAIGTQAMICVSLFQVFDAMTVTYANALAGAGDTAWASVVNVILCITILLGGGLLVIWCFPHLESFGIWVAAMVYMSAQGLAYWLRWRHGPWQLIELTDHDS